MWWLIDTLIPGLRFPHVRHTGASKCALNIRLSCNNTCAFCAAKPGLTLDWCKVADEGLPAPDIILYMNLSAAAAEKRGGFGEERYDGSEVQAAVRTRFAQLREAIQVASPGVWLDVEADGAVADIHAAIVKAVDARAHVVAGRQTQLRIASMADHSTAMVGSIAATGIAEATACNPLPIFRLWDGAPLT